MIENAVEVSNVGKVYEGAHRVLALNDVNLSLAEGEFASVLGPSGCGKSTLLNLIAGFERATSGSVRFFGEEIDQPGLNRAVVFQESALFPWLNVWENVVFSPKNNRVNREIYEPEARNFLQMIGLEKFAKHYPDQLSGGMKQRVGIARALLMEPRMFLMDEPFGALDAQTRLEMQEMLLDIWDKFQRTVMFITHDIEEAIFLSDTVYVMTARPGTIRSRIEVKLGRPRTVAMLTTPEFSELRRDIMSQIREECARARELEAAA